MIYGNAGFRQCEHALKKFIVLAIYIVGVSCSLDEKTRKGIMKKTLPIFLSLVLIFGFFSVNAFAAEEVPDGGDRVGLAVIDIGESAVTPLAVTIAVSGSTKSLAKDMASSGENIRQHKALNQGGGCLCCTLIHANRKKVS
jgi:uncharacterized membrane protein